MTYIAVDSDKEPSYAGGPMQGSKSKEHTAIRRNLFAITSTDPIGLACLPVKAQLERCSGHRAGGVVLVCSRMHSM